MVKVMERGGRRRVTWTLREEEDWVDMSVTHLLDDDVLSISKVLLSFIVK